MARKLAAGNWKMNGTSAALSEIATLTGAHAQPGCDVLICPPAPLLSRAADASAGTAISVGGQDCHANDAGASAVILGHSERRADHGETDNDVRAKAEAALSTGLTAIICIGESLAERDAGETLSVVGGQLQGSLPDAFDTDAMVVAYEPIWAIGTGKVPTLDQIAEVHDFLRAELNNRFGADTAANIPLLYGGSVKAANAAEIFAVANVDGALVGGASLKASDFSPIISALEAS